MKEIKSTYVIKADIAIQSYFNNEDGRFYVTAPLANLCASGVTEEEALNALIDQIRDRNKTYFHYGAI